MEGRLIGGNAVIWCVICAVFLWKEEYCEGERERNAPSSFCLLRMHALEIESARALFRAEGRTLATNIYEHFVKKLQGKLKFLEIDSTDLYEILTQYDYGYGLPFAEFSSKLIKKRGDKLSGRKEMAQKVE